MAYRLDVRFIKSQTFMPGDSVDAFLNMLKLRINNDESCYDVEIEYNKFRRSMAPYDAGLYIFSYIYILFYTNTNRTNTIQHQHQVYVYNTILHKCHHLLILCRHHTQIGINEQNNIYQHS